MLYSYMTNTTKKMKFTIKDFVSKCDQIRSPTYLVTKNFFFVQCNIVHFSTNQTAFNLHIFIIMTSNYNESLFRNIISNLRIISSVLTQSFPKKHYFLPPDTHTQMHIWRLLHIIAYFLTCKIKLRYGYVMIILICIHRIFCTNRNTTITEFMIIT